MGEGLGVATWGARGGGGGGVTCAQSQVLVGHRLP